MKQAILIRTDLKMGKGKLCSQCCHASIASFLKTSEEVREKWIREGMKKVVLKVSGEKELRNFIRLANKEKIPSALINDAGLTQVEPGTPTALGIGPSDDRKIDKITGKLKLL
ncbi:aminoacyl-tRNA hydrolase [Candidatus Micrarchaeota archaeon RBG_16_36_9]|nr:MAG: aminoacyl-tRNA hydrolase [Candidatus Micrarchaeota archaeon RBG_16_36_9]